MKKIYPHSATNENVEDIPETSGAEPDEKTGTEETDADAEQADYTGSQKEVADRAHEMIMANLERHITIAEFAQSLHASPTQIKVSFHKVYGAPIYTYARSQRMAAASKLLADTDESILEIAGKFGYENGSKFARAFRTVVGVSPSEYRKRIIWERENEALSAMENVDRTEQEE